MRIEDLAIQGIRILLATLDETQEAGKFSLERQREAVKRLIRYAGLAPESLIHTPEGQPRLLTSEAPSHISITHNKTHAAIALSEQPIGIDIEAISSRTLQAAPRIMCKSERTIIPVPLSEATATRLWCTKEAVFKLYGTQAETITQISLTFLTDTHATTASPYAAQVSFRLVEHNVLAVAIPIE